MSLSSKSIAWVAIVAVLFFVVLIGLQAAELIHYSADPSVWPIQ